MKNRDLFRRIVHWALTALILVYFITGFGITEFRTVEAVTFGLLTKNMSFKIHNNIWIPFVVLLILHILSSALASRFKVAGHIYCQKEDLSK